MCMYFLLNFPYYYQSSRVFCVCVMNNNDESENVLIDSMCVYFLFFSLLILSLILNSITIDKMTKNQNKRKSAKE